MKFLVRGDCTSRRALMLNRSKFPVGFSLVTNEKAPNVVFCDHLDGVVCKPEILADYIDESKMGKSQLLYFKRQFERNVLFEENASLLVIDPYSEMNFQLWRHKEEGWRFWVPKNSIRDIDKFSVHFFSDGYRTIEQSILDTARIVRHIQRNNPNMPSLFLPQILDFYPSLAGREYFNDMGCRLKDLIPELYVGARIPFHELVPEDLGTGGGVDRTLHFSGETYWKTASPSISAGLIENIAIREKQICERNIETPGQSKNILLANTDRLAISLQSFSPTCVPACEKIVQQVKTNLQQYFEILDPKFSREKDLKYRSAVIDIEKYREYSEYESVVKTSGKGARIRQRNKASRLGYICQPFHWRMHIPDIHEINTSTNVRSGGEMRASYLKSVEDMGGAPIKNYPLTKPLCPNHWTQPWGVFKPIEGYQQGTQLTNQKLVGYIFLRRFGEFLLYSQILGHYEYLQDGIMILLHHEVMKWVLDSHNTEAAGLKGVMYAGYDQGTDGLRDWKRREAFEPFVMSVRD